MNRAQQPWLPDEIERLRREAIVRPTPELAAEMGRSVGALTQQCLSLRIPRRLGKQGRPVGWRKVR